MVRKMFVIIAVAAAVGGATLSPTDAFARWGGWGAGIAIGHVGGWGWGGPGWGWRGAGWGWRRPGWGWGGIGFVGAPVFAYGIRCWRWVPTVWGPTRVWVC